MRKYQNKKRSSVLKNQRGATAVIVGVSMFALVGFAALVVDLGNIYVARNELQNAADAGALAGAGNLYNDSGTAINSSANADAYNVAKANFSQNKSVDVNWTPGTNGVDVQRGHWSFGLSTLAKGFTANESLVLTNLWDVTTAELDADPKFINAVRVIARRQATPVASFFAKIFGWKNFKVSAEAVGYIGFSGTINPGELDLPLAICQDSILIGGEYSCNIGRVINNGGDSTTSETGRWTNFASVPDEDPDGCEQEDPVDNSDFKDMSICDGELNEFSIDGGDELSTDNGEKTVLSKIHDCFVEKYKNNTLWKVTVPVIDCASGPGCAIVKGAVELNIVWVTGVGEDPGFVDAPTKMDDWSNSDTDGEVRWNDFVSHFNLKNIDGTSAPYAKKSIYFLPDCTPHDLTGRTGGENFGVLAKIPALVH